MEDRHYSQLGDWDILSRVLKERIVCDGDLSVRDASALREKFKPWVDSGIVCKEDHINPENPPELEFGYFLSEIGKDYISEIEFYGF